MPARARSRSDGGRRLLWGVVLREDGVEEDGDEDDGEGRELDGGDRGAEEDDVDATPPLA